MFFSAYTEAINKSGLFPGMTATLGTGNSLQNPIILNNGEADISMGTNLTDLEAYNGTKAYQGKPNPNIRFVGTYATTKYEIAVMKSANIKDLTDLKDKRIAIGQKTSASAQRRLELLKLFDMTEESITKAGGMVNWIGYADATSGMEDRRIDAFFDAHPSPYPNFQQLTVGKVGVTVIGFTQAQVDKILKDPGFSHLSQDIVPKENYGVAVTPQDLITFADSWCVIANKNVSDEMVYRLTKVLYETPSLNKALPDPSTATLKIALSAKAVPPMHPGAEKYYREKGLIK